MAHRTVKVTFGPAQIPQIVFRYATEKEVPVIGRVKPRQNIEILNCECIFPVSQRLSSAHEEHILVILRKKPLCPRGKQEQRNEKLPHYPMHIENIFPVVAYFS